MQQEGEPSVEEILESIKGVIARDNRATAKIERNRRESATPAVKEGPARPPQAPQANSQFDEADDDILDLSSIMSDLAEADKAIGNADPVAGDSGGPATEGLTTQGSTNAMRESLAALAAISVPSAQPQIVRSGETSLEGMVQELLRPMLAQWLETNLPQIVDEQVKAEIARIAGKKC